MDLPQVDWTVSWYFQYRDILFCFGWVGCLLELWLFYVCHSFISHEQVYRLPWLYDFFVKQWYFHRSGKVLSAICLLAPAASVIVVWFWFILFVVLEIVAALSRLFYKNLGYPAWVCIRWRVAVVFCTNIHVCIVFNHIVYM